MNCLGLKRTSLIEIILFVQLLLLLAADINFSQQSLTRCSIPSERFYIYRNKLNSVVCVMYVLVQCLCLAFYEVIQFYVIPMK